MDILIENDLNLEKEDNNCTWDEWGCSCYGDCSDCQDCCGDD